MRFVFISTIIFTLLLSFTPLVSEAQQPFVPCDGLECNTCHLVDMGNTILTWLIGILFVVFAIILAMAGWGLVTSAGNQAALNDAKSKFTNAFIGLFIVLAAWLIVDTIMRSLIKGGDGTLEGFGPWSQVECITPLTTQWVNESIVLGDRSDFSSSAPTACAENPDGIRVDCAAQVAVCPGVAQVDTSNPSRHTVTCNTPLGVEDPSTTNQVCDAGPNGDRVMCSGLEQECRSGGGTPTVDTSNPQEYQVMCAASSPTGACQTGEMSSMNLFGYRTTVNNSIKGKLESIHSEWSGKGGNSSYRVYSVGAYNCRRVTGGSRYSVHAYGLAVDVNPRDNPYVKKSGACPTNMPSSFSGMFTGRGFGWGANWTSVCDAMHFSGARKEGGWINL